MMDKIKLLVIDEPQLKNMKHTRLLPKLVELNQNFRVLCVSTTANRTIDAKLIRKWMIANIELQRGDPLGTPEDWLMNKKEISSIATPIESSLAGLLTELRNIGLRYTRNLLGPVRIDR